MRYRIFAPALLVPLLLFGSAAPASAQFDFGSWLQRAQIIANQITQITNQVRQLRSMASQLSELENQLDHLERAARGEIEALLAPFSDLAADPVGLVRNGLAWGSDFTGPGREMVGAVRDFGTGGSLTGLWRAAQSTADRMTEADILALYANHSPEVATRAVEDYRRAREAADRQRVLDYATLDAAARADRDHRARAGLVRGPHRERQPVKIARKSLCPLAHWLADLRDAPRVAPNVRLPPTRCQRRLVALAELGACAAPVAEAADGQPGFSCSLRALRDQRTDDSGIHH